jgi:hypothetical protein
MSGVRPSCRSITASEKDTLNGSGLAVGSAMAALLETGQQAVGSWQCAASRRSPLTSRHQSLLPAPESDLSDTHELTGLRLDTHRHRRSQQNERPA